MTKIKGTYETQGNQERVNFGEFGYICRTVVTAPRGAGYYDQHRIAKGDTEAVVSDVISYGGGLTEEVLAAALSAGFGRQIDARSIWSEAYGSAVGFMFGEKKFRKGCKVAF